MNLQLLNPFAHENFPERVDTSLDANAQCVRYNTGTSRFAGSLVAVGRTDGAVSILDGETRAYLRFLEGHVKAVTSLSWSRNSRYLLTASRDWNAIVWDVATGDRRETIRFDAPVTSAVFHPRNSKILVVTLQNSAEAVVVDLRTGQAGSSRSELVSQRVDDAPIAEARNAELELEEDAEPQADIAEAAAQPRKSSKSRGKGKQAKPSAGDGGSKKRRETATLARFNPRGDLVFVGSSAGTLHIFDTQTKMLLHTEKISGGSAIKHLEFDKAGTTLIINSNDRALRVYSFDELAFYRNTLSGCDAASIPTDAANDHASTSSAPCFILQHRFQDLVNRTPWNAIRFSNDEEYIVGGAGHKAAHQIYLWDRSTGNLSKILEGPKDPLEDIDWHPVRPACVSASSDHGVLHIWVTNTTERWAAYAAGFEELEENLEYQEREDEFDVENEEEVAKRNRNLQELHLDVTSDEPSRAAAMSLAAHTGHSEVAEHLASADEWADEEMDDDDRDDFFPPLDVDLEEFELDETDIREQSGMDTAVPATMGGRR